jgi:hypothetical protein
MTDVDYKKALEDHFIRFGAAVKRRDEAEDEIARLRQLIHATANMLSDEDRVAFESRIDALAATMQGLTSAVRDVLKKYARISLDKESSYMTAVQVRDELMHVRRFDFSGYASNPLASISTVLRRLKPTEAKSMQIGGVMAYRWIGSEEIPRRKLSLREQAFRGRKD